MKTTLQSKSHPLIKTAIHIRNRLDKDKNLFLMSGRHLFNEWLQLSSSSQFKLQTLFYPDNSQNCSYLPSHSDLISKFNLTSKQIQPCSPQLLSHLAGTSLNQKIIPSLLIERIPSPNIFHSNYKKILILDRIQDPGNLGSILRSSHAFGVDLVIQNFQGCDFFNAKVLSAARGAHFKLHLHQNQNHHEVFEQIQWVKQNSLSLFYADSQGTPLQQALTQKNLQGFCLILGNEGQGVDPQIKKEAAALCIEMQSSCESLNVAVASAILTRELSLSCQKLFSKSSN